MSTSAPTLPPAGQRHDREDALMQDDDTLTNGHMETEPSSTVSQDSSTTNVAVEVAAVDEDAMDTTPDNSQGLVLPNGSADPQEAAGITPSSPPPNGVAQEEPGSIDQPPAAVADAAATPPENAVC